MLTCSPGAPSTVTGTKMQCDSEFASVSFLLSISWCSLYSPTRDFMSLTHREDNAWFAVLNDECANRHMDVKSRSSSGNACVGWDTGHITNLIQSSKGNQSLGTICWLVGGKIISREDLLLCSMTWGKITESETLEDVSPMGWLPCRLHIGLGQCMAPSLDCSKCTGHTFANLHFDLKVTFRIPRSLHVYLTAWCLNELRKLSK